MNVEQRPIRVPSGAIELEGILEFPSEVESRAILVICHPHPLYGGSMDNNVVAALSDAALQEGMAALRFNFRGVGASGGVHSGGDPETGDVLAALAMARTLRPAARVSLAGYSFGAARAAAAFEAAPVAPAALVLVSLPRNASNPKPLPVQARNLLLITGDRDHVSSPDWIESAARARTPAADYVIIEGADHGWWGYEAELRDTVGGFLRWHAFEH
jgi:uncharacterized protein